MPMPCAFASAGVAEPDHLAAEHDLALIRGVHAAQDLHQGALAGAVLADQSVDLARQQIEIDAVERDRAAEALGDAAEAPASGSDGVTPESRRMKRWRRVRSASNPWLMSLAMVYRRRLPHAPFATRS